MVTTFGMSEIGPWSFVDGSHSGDVIMRMTARNSMSEKLAEDIDAAVKRLSDRAYEIALSQIRNNREAIDKIVEVLLEKETMSGDEFRAILSEFVEIPAENRVPPAVPAPLSLHSLIVTSGCSSNNFICNHLLNMYSKIGQLQTAVTLFGLMPRRNIMSCNIMINANVQSGDLESARKVFDGMTKRNIATWNAMVAGLVQFEFNEEGLRLLSEMHQVGFLPDEFTLGSVLRGCAGLRGLDAGRRIHCYVVKGGFELDLVAGSSLAHMYMKSGSLLEGEKVIRLMPVCNVIAWITLIAGKAQNGLAEDVLDQYNLMRMIHAEVVKAGASLDVGVISSLISMYSRCGCLDDSVKAFLECEYSDVVLWSSMIAAYGFHGKGEEAINLFEQMEQKEFEANDVTFVSLLYACSHCGLKEKGMEFFDLMVKKYGLKPRLEHYTCVVDLLGRCGCLDEAEALIRNMPVKADTIIWKTLLSACKIHKSTDMAGRIAEEVLKLNPRDAAPYVLLSNIHASAKRWQGVSEFREAMRERNVKKEPGVSWLEIKNQVHQFTMGDKSHPISMEIDLYLEELTSEMKLRGYVPDTGADMHDMDSEEKEYNLKHHSEKLAIAFAEHTRGCTNKGDEELARLQ
ncbi:hypothetical protein WN944_010132 [Citrus x changshan-huyou]|uniref:Peptidase M41 domain-containing protein n=1 Tax=Citrus x changshan-huyou TaxID=2935761 RepID=A0AAP0MVT8_9ROSI